MDIFTIVPSAGSATYEDGTLVEGLKTKLWVERYREPGEFTFVGPATDALREKLAIDTLVTHTKTLSLGIVEDHEIVEEEGEDPKLTVTGRSFDAFMEHRSATDSDQGFDPSLFDGTAWPYIFNNTKTYQHARVMMEQQMEEGSEERPSFGIPYFEILNEISDAEEPDDHEVRRGYLSPAVLSILAEINAGIKIERPLKGVHQKIWMVIHKGVDRSDHVIFSYERGDIKKARYYWSSRNYKNAAYIRGRYAGRYVSQDGFSGLSRRVMDIDATDINAKPGENGWTLDKLHKLLIRRANRALGRKRKKSIIEPTISHNAPFIFRRDYDIGDIVFVKGNYGVSQKMRVLEYTESEDESGEIGYPTLDRYVP